MTLSDLLEQSGNKLKLLQLFQTLLTNWDKHAVRILLVDGLLAYVPKKLVIACAFPTYAIQKRLLQYFFWL